MGIKELFIRFNNRYGLGMLEYVLASNWLNPMLTLYLNLRSLPFKQALKFPIWVYGHPCFYSLNGRMEIKGKVKSGMVKFNKTNLGPSNMGAQSEIINKGLIIFHGKGLIRTGNRISVESGAVLDIGENIRIGDMVNINCSSLIEIGNNVRVAHRSQIMDSNFHYIADINKRIVSPIMRPIKIGDNSWICNTSTISAGARISNNTIVASNSLVNKDFSSVESYSIIGGIPAKLIRSGYVLINNPKVVQDINRYYANCLVKEAYPLPDIPIDELGLF